MTFTYSNDPSTTPKDAVRFYLHDTSSTDVLFQDEEIAYMLTEWGPNVYDVCRAMAETLISRFTRLADSYSKSVGDISVSQSYASKAQEYQKLADSFLARRLRKSRPSIAVSESALQSTHERLRETAHTDFVAGQMDNPNTGLDTRLDI